MNNYSYSCFPQTQRSYREAGDRSECVSDRLLNGQTRYKGNKEFLFSQRTARSPKVAVRHFASLDRVRRSYLREFLLPFWTYKL